MASETGDPLSFSCFIPAGKLVYNTYRMTISELKFNSTCLSFFKFKQS
jgi:hypothetical protein